MKKLLLCIIHCLAFYNALCNFTYSTTHSTFNHQCSEPAQKFLKKCIPHKTTPEELFIIKMYLIALHTSLHNNHCSALGQWSNYNDDIIYSCYSNPKEQKRIRTIIKKIKQYLRKNTDTTRDVLEKLNTLIECL